MSSFNKNLEILTNELSGQIRERLAQEGFEPSKQQPSFQVWSKGDYTVEIHPVHSLHYSNGTVVASLDLAVSRSKAKYARKDNYWRDFQKVVENVNKELSRYKTSIDNPPFIPLNGNQKAEIKNIHLNFSKNTAPENVAESVSVIQKRFYDLLSKYVSQN